MPIAECAGVHGCQRSVSISAVPGGNPAANADPDGYASEWTFCATCRSYTCDRCLSRQQSRCRCGAPARLFTEAERIQMAQGGLPPAPPPSPPVSIAPPVHGPPTQTPVSQPSAPVQIRMMLEGIGMQIDADIQRNNAERARAMASLAATLMMTQGQNATLEDVPWLLWYGESYYRWRFFTEGGEYWKALYQLFKRLGKDDTDEGMRAIAAAGAFQLLGGELPADAPNAHGVAGFVQKVYGPAHVLTRDVYAKLGPPPSVAPGYPSAAPTPPSQALPLAPNPPRLPPDLAGLDGPTKLALWVTLAFLDIAVADGQIDEKEYLVWKQAMVRMQLPDVWERFGMPELQRMLQGGVLHALSGNFATLDETTRARLGAMLVEFMMADGRADPAEIQAIKRIGAWLGVALQVG